MQSQLELSEAVNRLILERRLQDLHWNHTLTELVEDYFDFDYRVDPSELSKKCVPDEFASNNALGAYIYGLENEDENLMNRGISYLSEALAEENNLEAAYLLSKNGHYGKMFAKAEPIQAYIVSKRIGNEFLTEESLDSMNKLSSEELILGLSDIVSAGVLDDELMQLMVPKLFDDYLGEMHSLIIASKDYEAAEFLADYIRENTQDLGHQCEAFVTSSVEGLGKVSEDLFDELHDEEVFRYSGLISQAKFMIAQVQRNLDISLPENVRCGGEKGTYATISRGSYNVSA